MPHNNPPTALLLFDNISSPSTISLEAVPAKLSALLTWVTTQARYSKVMTHEAPLPSMYDRCIGVPSAREGIGLVFARAAGFLASGAWPLHVALLLQIVALGARRVWTSSGSDWECSVEVQPGLTLLELHQLSNALLSSLFLPSKNAAR